MQATSDFNKKSDSKDPEDVQNPEDNAAAAAKVEEMLNMFDENLGYDETRMNTIPKSATSPWT